MPPFQNFSVPAHRYARLLVGLLLGGSITQARPAAAVEPHGQSLLINQSVQDELKLSKEQKDTVAEAAKKASQKIAARMKDVPEARRAQALRAVLKEVSEETDRALAGVLKGSQRKRFTQIKTQLRGPHAFSDPAVQKALRLTEEQKKRIKAIDAETTQKYREQTKNLDRRDPKRAALAHQRDQEAMTRIAAQLTPPQKQTWTDLVGERFQIKRQGRPAAAAPSTKAGP